MRVKATRRGFYVKLREPNEEFDVPDAQFSEKWMTRVKTPAEPVKPAVPERATVVPEPEPATPLAEFAEPEPVEAEPEAEPAHRPAVARRGGRKPGAK